MLAKMLRNRIAATRLGECKTVWHLWEAVSSFLKNEICNYHTPQQLHSWTFVPEKWKCTFNTNLCVDIHSSFIPNSQNQEASKRPTRGWMKCSMLTQQTPLSPQEKCNEGELRWVKKPIPKGYTLLDSIYITFLKITEMENRLVAEAPVRGAGGKWAPQ